MPVSPEALAAALAAPLERTDLSGFGQRYEGKVRDTYRLDDGRMLIVTTDRISAFDRPCGVLPLKGQVLTRCAAWWFAETAQLVPNHLLGVPDANVLLCRACRPLPVEFVVRAYLTGTTSTSILQHYLAGERSFCGHCLPDGLRAHQRLPTPLLTPSSKAKAGEHDRSLSRQELIDSDVITAADFDAAAAYAMALFAHGTRRCADRGLLLVDTKYEFGQTPEGELLLIDEVHTPDSSRFWYADGYEEALRLGQTPAALDKEYLRRWLIEQGAAADAPLPTIPNAIRIEAARRYIEAYESITGEAFVAVLRPGHSASLGQSLAHALAHPQETRR